MENRPAMFTGESTLRSINNFISGYYHALVENKIVQQPQTGEPFHDWVAKKLNYPESTGGWGNMIVANSMGIDPKNIRWRDVFAVPVTQEQHWKSIKLFYELVEEFKNENHD